jgi:signal transduction histidine kinase
MTETEQKKVFTPNFTTKSSGMGVGLSIVHNIVKAAGGSISFRSEPGIGTSFTLILPVSRDDLTR